MNWFRENVRWRVSANTVTKRLDPQEGISWQVEYELRLKKYIAFYSDITL
jgi:hypothetical protein